jgi:hypothetical protein
MTDGETDAHLAALSRLVNAQARSIGDLENVYRDKRGIDKQRIAALEAEVQSLRGGLLAALSHLAGIIRTQRRITTLATDYIEREPMQFERDGSQRGAEIEAFVGNS